MTTNSAPPIYFTHERNRPSLCQGMRGLFTAHESPRKRPGDAPFILEDTDRRHGDGTTIAPLYGVTYHGVCHRPSGFGDCHIWSTAKIQGRPGRIQAAAGWARKGISMAERVEVVTRAILFGDATLLAGKAARRLLELGNSCPSEDTRHPGKSWST